ncbi:MAG: MarR family transcriptional regulator [Alphaproteobacteria bacterium]
MNDTPALFTQIGAMPGHLLRRCQQIAVSIFLRECRVHDLTPLQFAVLSALASGPPLDHIRLAGIAALDRTTVGVVARKLEARGLVTRRVSDTDRRSKLIAITDAGRTLIARALPAAEAAQDHMLAPLTAAERTTLLALLAKMADGNNEQSRAPLRGP